MKKAKWFTDLPKEEQKAITKKERAYQKEQWAILKTSFDKQKQEEKKPKGTEELK